MSETAQQQDDTSLMGPGARLRIARESTRLSIHDVARFLHLKPDVIQDIENDDYSRAPRIVFLRGYIRSYAKLLDLPPDEVIAALDKFYQEEQTIDSYMGESQRIAVYDSSRWVRGISAFMGLVALFGIAVWWHTQKNSNARDVQSSASSMSIYTQKTKQENMPSYASSETAEKKSSAKKIQLTEKSPHSSQKSNGTDLNHKKTTQRQENPVKLVKSDHLEDTELEKSEYSQEPEQEHI